MKDYVVFVVKRMTNFLLWHSIVLLAVCCLIVIPVCARDPVGEIMPRHAEIPIGGSVNITCRMNKIQFNDMNSSCLTFFNENRNESIPQENIRILNETSIVFMLRNATKQSSRYICKCDQNGVDATSIEVGTPPTNVTDFKCRGYDFSYLICNFTIPENMIFTNYSLKVYSISQGYYNYCSLQSGSFPSQRICNITIGHGYHIIHDDYKFQLTATNTLGSLNQSINIHQYNCIVPEKPAVRISDTTTDSVTLTWTVSKYSQYSYTKGLHYEIRLRPDKFPWIEVDTSSSNSLLSTNGKELYWIDFKNLEYAFRRYDVIVRARTVRAGNDNTLWSEPFHGTFETKPRLPDSAPLIDVGSFYIDPTEKNLRLYWQQLPEYRENGPDFKYVITEVRRDGIVVNISPVHIDHTSATFQWQSTSLYEFKVKSQNRLGQSRNTSFLNVPPSTGTERSLPLEQIHMITKVYHNQTYTISWWKPDDSENLIDFTVFWCISKMESQSQCKGTIEFKHFDKTTNNYTTEPQNHTLNFAVSANYRSYSTGMIWAICNADSATDLTKMDLETTNKTANSLNVQWSTECLYTAILVGYNLTYCKVSDCIDTEKTISLQKSIKEYEITGLEPNTIYKISILMYSKVKVGPVSNPYLASTDEDAPSPPRKLKFNNRTSSSAVLSWLPPVQRNGIIRYYTIWYNNDHYVLNNTNYNTEEEITLKLENLYSFSDYKVYVTAHTVKSSKPSNDVHFKTLIGTPSKPRPLNFTQINNSLVLQWADPAVPSGRVEFYEVRANIWKNNETTTKKKSRIVGNLCQIEIPPCDEQGNSYSFDVRAVNIAYRSEIDLRTFSKRNTVFHSSEHQSVAKRRRHTNAEINSSIGASYMIRETSEKPHHRHERENVKFISTTTETTSSEMSSVITAPLNDALDNNWICVRSQSAHINDSEYVLFYSDWENGPYYACGVNQSNKIIIVVLVISTIVLLIFVSYNIRKKYNKMSNIGLVIPEGLDDHVDMSKGFDNTIERDEITRSGSFHDPENHRLLSKVGNDSGILNSATCLDKGSGFVCPDQHDSDKSSQSTDSVELNDITSCSYTSSLSNSPNANMRGTVTPDIKFAPPILQTDSVHLRPSENGYIKPMMMCNGYVQPQAISKLQTKEDSSPPGYTTLDKIGKTIFPDMSVASNGLVEGNGIGVNSKDSTHKDIATNPPPNGNICGYVTHKQLYSFGQQ